MSLIKTFMPFLQFEQLVGGSFKFDHLEQKLACVPDYAVQIDAIEPVVIDPIFYARYFEYKKEWLVAGYSKIEGDFLVFSINETEGEWMRLPASYFASDVGHRVLLDLNWFPTKLSRCLDQRGLTLVGNDELCRVPELNCS